MYLVKYLIPEGIAYRMVRANNPNHAMRIAEKRASRFKNWQVISVTQDDKLN